MSHYCPLYSLCSPSRLLLDLHHGHPHLPSLLPRLALRGRQWWANVTVLLTKLTNLNIDIWPTFWSTGGYKASLSSKRWLSFV